MSYVKFNYGTEAQVSAAPITEGYLYYITDKNALAYDLNGSRFWIKNDMIMYSNSQNWNEQASLVPAAGTIVIYSDAYTASDGEKIPGIKIADGSSFLIDQPFITQNYDELITAFNNHVSNTTIHLTAAEKEFLTSSALGCSYSEENLIFNTYKGA